MAILKPWAYEAAHSLKKIDNKQNRSKSQKEGNIRWEEKAKL